MQYLASNCGTKPSYSFMPITSRLVETLKNMFFLKVLPCSKILEEPGRTHRNLEPFPEPGSLCKDPIAFCRWGKRVICNPQKFHHPHLQTSAATPQKLQLQHLFFLGRKSLPFYCTNLRFHHQAGITTSRLNADGASSKFWCSAMTKTDCKAWRR